MSSTTTTAERDGRDAHAVLGRAASAVGDVGTRARTAVVDTTAVVADHAPAALSASRGIIERILAALRGSSSDSLALGTVFAAGVSAGMQLSGAPRVLVALACLPTLLLGGTLLGRRTTRLEQPPR